MLLNIKHMPFQDLNSGCRLESLTLELGHMTPKDADLRNWSGNCANVQDVPLVCSLAIFFILV